MIHRIELPDLTRKCLTDLVMLQLRLLKYASDRRTLTKVSCADSLNESKRFRGRGVEIANWLWRGPKRLALLKSFAGAAHSGAKIQWVQELSQDVIKLLRLQPGGDLHKQNYQDAPVWQKSGADFLRKFYSDWYAQGFPEYFFSESIAEPFTRHAFIEAFEHTNDGLHVCAACDNATAISGQESNRKSSLDHYFPKESYPHLVLHPFNLIPGCHFCNSEKGSNDVMGDARRRRDLSEIILPFREPGLRESAYLQAKFKGAKLDVQFGKLRPLRNSQVQSRIDAFSDVFKIPIRWEGDIDRIGEKLFRHMRQFRGANSKVVKAPDGLVVFLEDMLETYRQEDLGKDAYVFAMSCWLEKILKHAVRPMVNGSPNRAAEQRFASIQEQLRVKLTKQ
jgi:hypothetical protein